MAKVFSIKIVLPLVLLWTGIGGDALAQNKKWNSDLSKMMDGIEQQIGPAGAPKTPPPQQELPPEPVSVNQEPKPKPKSQVQAASKSEVNKFLNSLLQMKDNYLGTFAKDGLIRWPQSRMPIKVYIEPTSKATGFKKDYPGLLKQAYQTWQKVSEGRIRVSFVSQDSEAQIVCRWTDNKDDLMAVEEGGNAVVVPDDEGILASDVKLLTLPPPGVSETPAEYMMRKCLHEAGHSLGISGHSPYKVDVMYPSSNAADKGVLSQRDKNSIVELYKVAPQLLKALKLDLKNATPEGVDSRQTRAIRLNNEATQAIEANKYNVAIEKLKTAHNLDPGNKSVCTNLGGIYANMGSIAGMTFNLNGAATYYKKAIPLLEKGVGKGPLISVLSNYLKVLKMQKKESEAKKIEAKLAKLTR